jgi:hypothetical protein
MSFCVRVLVDNVAVIADVFSQKRLEFSDIEVELMTLYTEGRKVGTRL